MASMASVTVRPGVSGSSTPQAARELRPRRRVGHLLVAGVDVGQGAHVAGALHVVLAAQRVHAGARPAEVAGEQRQVADGQHVLGAVRVLGDAHRVDDGGARGRAPNRRAASTSLSAGTPVISSTQLRRVRRQDLAQRLEALGALGDELLVGQALVEDDVHEAVEQRHVGARPQLQVQTSARRAMSISRGSATMSRAPLRSGLLDVQRADGVRLGRVGADDQDRVGRRSRSTKELVMAPLPSDWRQAGDGGGVAEPRAVVHVVACRSRRA